MKKKNDGPGPGMPFSIVAPVPSVDPAEWLSSIEMRLRLTRDMAADGRIETPPGTKELLRDAMRWCDFAQKTLAWNNAGNEPPKEPGGIAMMALHHAWLVEMKIGAQIRLEDALRFEKQRGARKVESKTQFYIDLIKQFPEKKNQALAHHIFDKAPRGDDGEALFYYDEDRAVIDRKTGKPITFGAMTGQIQRARSQHVSSRKSRAKKTVG